MKTFPNQKVVVPKMNDIKQGEQFFTIGVKELSQASQDLTGGEFKLWIYLRSWKKDTRVAFSPGHVEQTIGLSRATIGRAWNGLIEKKYLILLKGNYYALVTPKQKMKDDISLDEINKLYAEMQENS